MIKTLLLLLSAGKVGPALVSVGSMVLSLAVYAQVFGWGYAGGVVALLLLHEMGHYVAARRRGLAAGLPAFIPFVGAWVALRHQPLDVEDEANIALAGPMLGTLGAIACLVVAVLSDDDPLWLAIAYAGFFINLFNLLPIGPLDGGRITAALSPRLWLLGAPALAALFFWMPSPLLLVIVVLALPSLWQAIRYDPNAPENARYHGLSMANRLEFGVTYLALAAFLAVMCHEIHGLLGPG